jgi:hypothetical protein
LACSAAGVVAVGFIFGRATAPPPSGQPTAHSKAAIRRKLGKAKVKDEKAGTASDPLIFGLGELDVRRKWQIVTAGPTDHAGEVIVKPLSDFDLNRTIFGSMEGALPRIVQHSKLAVELYWTDPAVRRVTDSFALLPPPPSYKTTLVRFMQEDCNFSIEHADGSFMDHLKFCHDYTVANYKNVSPVPLLLHSIMGVGTNFFPMSADLIPKLQTLITPQEFVQVEAFPSLLRLTLGTDLLDRLEENVGNLNTLNSITFHRVIDNKEVSMSAADFWIQMNYQLVHMLDFLPTASWLSQMDDNFLCSFIQLYRILTDGKLLEANVNFDLTSGEKGSDGIPVTLGSIFRGILPTSLKLKLAQKAIGKFSAKINHDLAYDLSFRKASMA